MKIIFNNKKVWLVPILIFLILIIYLYAIGPENPIAPFNYSSN